MSKRVLKYNLPPPGGMLIHTINHPAFPLHVAEQHGAPMLWMEVPNVGRPVGYAIHCFGTGREIPDHFVNLGCLIDGGGEVWHYYLDRPF